MTVDVVALRRLTKSIKDSASAEQKAHAKFKRAATRAINKLERENKRLLVAISMYVKAYQLLRAFEDAKPTYTGKEWEGLFTTRSLAFDLLKEYAGNPKVSDYPEYFTGEGDE